MANNICFIDNTDKYNNLIPASVKKDISLYKEILEKVSIIQDKLQKNFYRVLNFEKLDQEIEEGKFKVAKYSIIEEHNSTFKHVKFCDFFVNEFNEITELLNKLEGKLNSGDYKDYINSLSVAYKTNNFIEPYRRWVQLDNSYPIDFIALPTEPDLDKKYNTILSFDGSLRVLSPEFLTIKSDQYLNSFSSLLQSIPRFSELHYQIDPTKIKARVDTLLISTGVHCQRRFYGQNLPNEIEFVKSWGSKILVYKNVLDENSENGLYDLGNDVFSNFDLTSNELSISLSRKFLTHEITESLTKFEGSEERLGLEFLKVREMNSEVGGLKNYSLFLVKFDNSEKLVKNLLFAFLVAAFSYFKRKHLPEDRSPHYYGYVYTLNYLLKNGGLTVKDKKVIVNSKIALKNIFILADEVRDLFMFGTKEDANKFFSSYLEEDKLKNILSIK